MSSSVCDQATPYGSSLIMRVVGFYSSTVPRAPRARGRRSRLGEAGMKTYETSPHGTEV